MTDDAMVRVVLEHREGGGGALVASDLTAFRRVLGEEVLTAFCCCFIQADRINSLIAMFHESLEKHGNESTRSKRDLMAFHGFAVGTLKELGIALSRLRRTLRKMRNR